MKSLCTVTGVALLFIFYSVTPAFSINFDNVDASLGDVSLDALNPYEGFTWSNFSIYTNTPGFTGFNNGIVSPNNAAFSGGEIFGETVTPVVGKISAANTFDFTSGYLGSGYYDNLDVTIQGLLNGAVVFSQTVAVNTQGAQLFNFGFTGINELDFFGLQNGLTTDPFGCGTFNCTQFTLDDVSLAFNSAPPPAAVPESSTLTLLSLGMMALFMAANRRVKATS